MSERERQLLAIADRILDQFGLYESRGYNRYPVNDNGEISIYVTKIGLPQKQDKKAIETRKRRDKQFKEAKKAFKKVTGCVMRLIWQDYRL